MLEPLAEMMVYLIGCCVMPFAALFGGAWPWAMGTCAMLGLFLWCWHRFCDMTSRHEAAVHKAFLEELSTRDRK